MFAYLFLTITAAFCGYFIYKIIALYATRQERQTIIERLDSEGLKEYLKYMQAGTSLQKVVNNELGNEKKKIELAPIWFMRLAFVTICIGIAIMVGFDMAKHYEGMIKYNENHIQFDLIFTSFILVGAGLGFFLSYIVEVIIKLVKKLTNK